MVQVRRVILTWLIEPLGFEFMRNALTMGILLADWLK